MGAAALDEQTAATVRRVFGQPDAEVIAVTPVGAGQVARCQRVVLRGDAGEFCCVVKSPSLDETSRSTARVQQLYRRETSFYRELQPQITTRTPVVHDVFFDEVSDDFLLVLEDLTPARSVDQFDGLGPDDAARALTELAGLHAATGGREELFSARWLGGVASDLGPLYEAVIPSLFNGFLERYADQLDDRTAATVATLRDHLGALWGRPVAQRVVTHGDYRCENLLFDGRDGTVPIAVVDWQTVGVGSPLLDVAYFLVTSLTTSVRRDSERELLAHYMGEMSARGAPISDDVAVREVARYTLQPIGMLVSASMIVERTERGDAMFLTMINRAVDAVDDWDAFAELTS
jgi:hypothetical protein